LNERCCAQIEKEKGRIDIVFANAGISPLAPLGEITENHYDALFDTNVKVVALTVQRRRGRGTCRRDE
jgi:NAD(P)-dependent dehydrogenase (short-subunit alcohol dehydrogenase family)